MIMSPKALDALGDKFATAPVCVGPFMFKDRVAGDHITLVKSPFYYNKKNVHLNQITWKIITDPAARAANLRSGDVNVAEGIASTDLASIQSNKALKLVKATSIGYQGITVNIGNSRGLGKLPYTNTGTAIANTQAREELLHFLDEFLFLHRELRFGLLLQIFVAALFELGKLGAQR